MKPRENKNLPIFTLEDLSKYKGTDKKRYIGVKGLVFDVSTNEAYKAPEGGYSMFPGFDASVALGKMNHEEQYFDKDKFNWRKDMNKQELIGLN